MGFGELLILAAAWDQSFQVESVVDMLPVYVKVSPTLCEVEPMWCVHLAISLGFIVRCVRSSSCKIFSYVQHVLLKCKECMCAA